MKNIVLWSPGDLGCLWVIVLIFGYAILCLLLQAVAYLLVAAVFVVLTVGGALFFVYLIARFLFMLPNITRLKFPVFSYLLQYTKTLVCVSPQALSVSFRCPSTCERAT